MTVTFDDAIFFSTGSNSVDPDCYPIDEGVLDFG